MFIHNLVVGTLKKHWFVGVRSIDVNCVCDIYLYNISYDCNKSIDVLTLFINIANKNFESVNQFS